MNLDLEDHQVLAVRTFRDFLQHEATAARVREIGDKGGFDAELWRRFGDLGGASLSLAEQHGGGGGTLLDAALIGEECGRRVAPLPYAEAVVALRLLAGTVPEPLRSELLAGALAVPGEPASVQWHADGTVSARVAWVRGAAAARYLALTAGERLAVVDLEGPGVVRTEGSNLGCFPLGRVELDHVAPRAVGAAHRLRARAELRVLHAAELVGAGRQALALVRDHVVTRRQFGRPIGSFQAVQHRLADCLTALDAAELLVRRAASYTDDEPMLDYFSAICLLQAVRAAERAAGEGLQFFGGYGFTLEYDIHLYVRFTKALGVLARDGALPAAAFRPPVPRGGRSG